MSINEITKAELLEVSRIVAKYNMPLGELHDNLKTYLADAADVEGKMAAEASVSPSLFEALSRVAPRLSDAIHDFVYQIAVAHRSITRKDIAREQIVKELFNL